MFGNAQDTNNVGTLIININKVFKLRASIMCSPVSPQVI